MSEVNPCIFSLFSCPCPETLVEQSLSKVMVKQNGKTQRGAGSFPANTLSVDLWPSSVFHAGIKVFSIFLRLGWVSFSVLKNIDAT